MSNKQYINKRREICSLCGKEKAKIGTKDFPQYFPNNADACKNPCMCEFTTKKEQP